MNQLSKHPRVSKLLGLILGIGFLFLNTELNAQELYQIEGFLLDLNQRAITVDHDLAPHVKRIYKNLQAPGHPEEWHIAKYNQQAWRNIGLTEVNSPNVFPIDDRITKMKLITGPDNLPYAMYSNTDSGISQVKVRKFNGELWENPIGGAIPVFGHEDALDIAIAENGSIFIVHSINANEMIVKQWTPANGWVEIGLPHQTVDRRVADLAIHENTLYLALINNAGYIVTTFNTVEHNEWIQLGDPAPNQTNNTFPAMRLNENGEIFRALNSSQIEKFENETWNLFTQIPGNNSALKFEVSQYDEIHMILRNATIPGRTLYSRFVDGEFTEFLPMGSVSNTDFRDDITLDIYGNPWMTAFTADQGGNHGLTVYRFGCENLFGDSTPVPLTPQHEAINIVPDNALLEWSPVSDCQDKRFYYYEVQVATDAGFQNIVESSVIYSTEGEVISVSPENIQNNASYFWRVRVKGSPNWSDAQSFTTVFCNIPPVLVSPENDFIFPHQDWDFSTEWTLVWEPSLECNGDVKENYTLEVSTHQNFGVLVVDLPVNGEVFYETNDDGNFYVTLPNLTQHSAYYWRVGHPGEDQVSETRRFNNPIPDEPPFESCPGIANLNWPPDNSGPFTVSEISLIWYQTYDSCQNQFTENYRIQIATDPDFNSIVIDEFGNSIFEFSGTDRAGFSFSGLLSSTEYFWRVKSEEFFAPVPWSDTWSFQTGVINHDLAWETIQGPNIEGLHFRSVLAIDENRIHVGTEDGRIFYTTDGGTTWLEATIDIPSGSINSMTKVVGIPQMAVATDTGMYFSNLTLENDNFSHFERAYPSTSRVNEVKSFMFEGGNLFAVTDSQRLLFKNVPDNGLWTARIINDIDQSSEIKSITMNRELILDEHPLMNRFFAVGNHVGGNAGTTYLFSEDSANSWSYEPGWGQDTPNSITNSFLPVDFYSIDHSKGFNVARLVVSGSHDALYLSENPRPGAYDWEPLNFAGSVSDSEHILRRIELFNLNPPAGFEQGFAVGSHGRIVFIKQGLNDTWSAQVVRTGTSYDLYDLSVALNSGWDLGDNLNVAFAVGDNGTILRTQLHFEEEPINNDLWEAIIDVEENQGGKSSLKNSRSLILGMAENATNGYDSGLDQLAPPMPPFGAFDARIISGEPPVHYFKDFRPVSEEATEWRLQLTGSTDAVSFNLSWNPTAFADYEGDLQLRFGTAFISTIDMKEESLVTIPVNSGIITVTHVPAQPLEVELTYSSGWNLVSLPAEPEDTSVETFFPGMEPDTFFGFNGSYTDESSFSNGKGYWLFLNESEGFTLVDDLLESVSIDLKNGWNLIGSVALSVLEDEINDPNSILLSGSIYGYLPGAGYFSSTSVNPGRGYWIRALADGSISLEGSAKSTSLLSEEPLYPQFHTVYVQNNDTQGRDFFFGSPITDEMPPNHAYELPPMPPIGAFDVRFQNHTWLTEARETSILVQSPGETLTFAFHASENEPEQIMELTIIRGTQMAETYQLYSGESVTVEGTGITKVDVSVNTTVNIPSAGNELPLIVELAQNYPNPFNPTTNITYGLPESGTVKLDVYNVMGQRVATLVNDQKPAGYHTVTFDASRLASGTYVYRLQTGNQVITKKLMLVK